MRQQRHLSCWWLLGGLLALSACGEDQPAPSFAPADYSYLSKLRFDVGSLGIEDHSASSSGTDSSSSGSDISQSSPLPPDQALQQMAHDRLVAAGNAGRAVFTIDQASITGSQGGRLDGHMAVHLDIIAANGAHAGYAEAHVSHQFIPGSASSDDGGKADLYNLTQAMMQDMNVELEFQVKHTLRDWLVDASGAPIASSVEQQNLGVPGAAPVGTTPLGATPLSAAPLAPALPAAQATAAPALATPGPVAAEAAPTLPLRSPPPHFLQAPTPPSQAAPSGN